MLLALPCAALRAHQQACTSRLPLPLAQPTSLPVLPLPRPRLCRYHFDARVRVGVECIRACDAALAGMHRLSCPLLVAHSERDDMTDPDGSKLLVATAKVRRGDGAAR